MDFGRDQNRVPASAAQLHRRLVPAAAAQHVTPGQVRFSAHRRHL